MDNFTSNINLKPADVALMVSHICIPEGTRLLGILPILAILFGTDNVDSVIKSIKGLSSTNCDLLISTTQNTVTHPTYPLNDSVWQFNDPASDISALTAALKHTSTFPLDDLVNFLNLYSDTFPFIHTYFEELDPTTVLETQAQSDDCILHVEVRDNPLNSTELGPSAFIVPSVALGSLWLLSSKLKNTNGDARWPPTL